MTNDCSKFSCDWIINIEFIKATILEDIDFQAAPQSMQHKFNYKFYTWEIGSVG